MVALLSCCCCGGVGWYWTSSYTELGETVDRIHREVLPEGDVEAAWRSAAPSLREKHTKDELASFLDRYQRFRRATRLPDSSLSRKEVDGQSYLVLKLSVVVGWARVETFWFVCRVDEDGTLHLVGVRSILSGSLDGAIPEAIKPLTESHHKGWDWD
jgi:hypothetical protein